MSHGQLQASYLNKQDSHTDLPQSQFLTPSSQLSNVFQTLQDAYGSSESETSPEKLPGRSSFSTVVSPHVCRQLDVYKENRIDSLEMENSILDDESQLDLRNQKHSEETLSENLRMFQVTPIMTNERKRNVAVIRNSAKSAPDTSGAPRSPMPRRSKRSRKSLIICVRCGNDSPAPLLKCGSCSQKWHHECLGIREDDTSPFFCFPPEGCRL
ncbi:uncharacterized protein LOC134178324 [Corticium candelabrum]|uniref:uncharacterized protein LOC134178324 n=1 Tax=Corticium candelabrum TaxID=121492 RepID=UPI002E2583AA|nr:uncharacterized protein LOC134178324 [Corticium candelabrum]